MHGLLTGKPTYIIVRSQSIRMPAIVRSSLMEKFQNKAEFIDGTKPYQFLMKINPGIFHSKLDAVKDIEMFIDSLSQKEEIIKQTSNIKQLEYELGGVYAMELDSESFRPSEWPKI